VVREGYAKAAAAAGVKTLFCGGFGRRFFIYTVYFVCCGRSKLQHLIRIATAKTPSFPVLLLQATGHATCHHC
jgi:hypothetical protein